MKIKMNTHKIGLPIGTGFLIMVLLMVALTLVGLSYIAQVNSRMKHIVENNNVKIALAQIMQNALLERALSMHAIAVYKDEFLKDEEYMYFNHQGSNYYSARKSLEELTTSSEELAILFNIRTLTQQTQPEVQEVIELGLGRYDPTVFETIRKQTIPKQRLIIEQVNKLVSLQKEQATTALKGAQSSYDNARNLMVLLGSLATLLGLVITFFVLRHVTRQARQLEHQALHDELTGLPNRVLFYDRLKNAIKRGQRQVASFSIILLDLDRFKLVNDTLGHHVGDQLLQEVARRLKSNVRELDTVARLGGDEYMILFESLSIDKVIQLVDKLSLIIAEPFLLAGEKIDVGASMGIASYPEHGQDCMTFIKRADAAMYEAKRNGTAYMYYVEQNQQNQN